MTNAIEQAKREMYDRFNHAKELLEPNGKILGRFEAFEFFLERYVEITRQDHEALHETARKRFEDLQVAEADNEDIGIRLAKMTEERDAIQLRLHAVDHAYKTQQERTATPTQDSGDRASCATSDAKTMAILGSVLDVQRIVSDWALGDSKAKHSMRNIAAVVNGDLEVAKALDAFQNPPRCMHSFHHVHDHCIYCGERK